MASEPGIVEGGIFVPADLAGDLARALDLLRRERSYDGGPWSSETEMLRRMAGSVEAVMRQKRLLERTSTPPTSGVENDASWDQDRNAVLTKHDAASYLQVGERRVRQLADKGLLPARRTANGWEFDRDAVEKFAATRKKIA